MNEQTFTRYLYNNCYQKTINSLSQKAPEKRALIEDCVQEAITRMWFLKQKGKLKHEANLCGFLYTVAKNDWLNQQKKRSNMQELDDNTLGKLTEEMASEIDLYSKDAIRRQAVKNAFDNLGKKCKLLLQRFLIDDEKLKNLADELGYGSYDSIKSSKRQCVKQLEKKFTIELDKLS